MTCKPGDIAAIPFPYSDLTTRKKRPVLVITKPDRYGDFVGLAVTTVLSVEKSLAIAEESLLIGKCRKRAASVMIKFSPSANRCWLKPLEH